MQINVNTKKIEPPTSYLLLLCHVMNIHFTEIFQQRLRIGLSKQELIWSAANKRRLKYNSP